MNILFVNSIKMWGGGEVWLMDMVRELARRGHQVHILCRRGTPLAERAPAHCVHAIRFGGDADPGTLVTAARILRRRRVDVVCTNTDKDLRVGGLAARLAGVRGVVPSREVDYPLKDTRRYRFAYDRLATAIAANSQATKRTLLASAPWLRPERVHVIYKGIDLAPFDAPAPDVRQELGIPAGAPVVGFVGTLDARKGVPVLLEAFAAVRAQVPEAVLVLAGRGPLAGDIEARRSTPPLRHALRPIGFREDVPALMRAIDVLALPSQWEGFGYVLVEAMAARRPTVASATSSIPEIVVDGETGALVAPGDARALAAAIVALLRDPTRRRALGEAGRRRVESLFTLGTMVDGFETLFAAQIRRP